MNAAEAALAAYHHGEISAEIALMRLMLALGGAVELLAFLERRAPIPAPQPSPASGRGSPPSQGIPPPQVIPSPASRGGSGWGPAADALLQIAHKNRAGLDRIAQLIAAGLVHEQRDTITAIREQFDRAAALAPEAAVALYSLGSPETLERATAEIVERLQEWRLLGPAVDALDIGCGIGRIERALSPHLRHITGIDLSPAMVAEARQRCAHLGNAEFACCSGADLSAFNGSRFDLVLAVDAFPYMVAAHPDIAARHIADAAALLAPGGALAILNYSYRGDLDRDRADVGALAERHHFTVTRNGTCDFTLWDGATFLLRKTR